MASVKGRVFSIQNYDISFDSHDGDSSISVTTTDRDHEDFMDHVAEEKIKSQTRDRNSTFRKKWILNEFVILDLLFKHGIDIYEDSFIKDKDKYKRFERIMQTHYPALRIS